MGCNNLPLPYYLLLAHKSSYSALPIYRGPFAPNNSRETPIARPLGRGMGIFREILVWPKFYIQI